MTEPNFEALKLENQVCFPLYACARETIKLYKPFLDELNLTYTQYITLLVLWEKKQVTVRGEAELQALEKAVEEAGYTVRK